MHIYFTFLQQPKPFSLTIDRYNFLGVSVLFLLSLESILSTLFCFPLQWHLVRYNFLSFFPSVICRFSSFAVVFVVSVDQMALVRGWGGNGGEGVGSLWQQCLTQFFSMKSTPHRDEKWCAFFFCCGFIPQVCVCGCFFSSSSSIHSVLAFLLPLKEAVCLQRLFVWLKLYFPFRNVQNILQYIISYTFFSFSLIPLYFFFHLFYSILLFPYSFIQMAFRLIHSSIHCVAVLFSSLFWFVSFSNA